MKINLCLLKKDGTRKLLSLPCSVTTIGRRRDCDLCIPLPSVSRRHCEINTDQGRLTLRDLSSKNGTYLNGDRIDEAQAKPGDEIQIGELCFVVQIDGVPEDLGSFKPHPVHEAASRSVSADAVSPEESAFADMIKEMSGMDLNQTLKTDISERADQIL